jgi:serine/threonine-protein kinase
VTALCTLVFVAGLAVMGTVTPAGAKSPGSLELYGPPKGLIGPGNGLAISGLAADGAGDVFMATSDHAVVELQANTGIGIALPTPAATQIAVDGNGDVFTSPLGEGLVSKLSAGSTTAVTVPLTDVTTPDALATDRSGDLFVADPENQKVVELVAGATTPITLPFTGLSYPTGIAVDEKGDVFVTDGGANDVLELATGTTISSVVPISGLNVPNAIAVNANGDVFVTDDGNRVTEFDAETSVQRTLPFTGLGSASGIAVDGSGDLLVSDSVNKEVFDLTPDATTPRPLYLNISRAGAVAFDRSGDTFVPDVLGNRIIELQAGTDAPSVLPLTGLDEPNGVAVDAAGDVFVSQKGPQSVIELPAGSSSQITLPITAPSGAAGVAVDGDGDVFAILDGNGSIDNANEVVELPSGATSPLILPFPGPLDQYSSVAVDSAGDVAVAGYDMVAQIPQDLELAAGSNSPAALPFTGLTYPGVVALDGAGDVFASGASNDSVAELLGASGTQFTLAEITGVNQPSGLSVSSTGTLDVASSGGSVVQFAGLGQASAPGASTGVTALPGNGQMTVTFSPPLSNGGFPITSYTVTGIDNTTPANPHVSQSVSGGPVTFTGLVNGDFYTFSVSAINVVGPGPAASARPRAPGTLPAAPSVSTVTAGNGMVTLKLSPPQPVPNPPVLFYTVTATNLTDAYSTGQTVSSVSAKVKITGLLNGDSYSFVVSASNEVGTGQQSSPTVGIVAGGPGKPRSVKIVAGSGQATVSFRPPASAGASPIVSYTVMATDVTSAARGGQTVTGTGSPLAVTGLTHGDSYTFSVAATNSDGSGVPAMLSKQFAA